MLELLTAFVLYYGHANYLWWIGYIIVMLIEILQDLKEKGYYDNETK